mmetsp:Transcript_471/g.901  ORF Transcript_471/g.901 Transcript_471/m.901 type:complete len:225 (+) Transcript_471:1339-2013(+)
MINAMALGWTTITTKPTLLFHLVYQGEKHILHPMDAVPDRIPRHATNCLMQSNLLAMMVIRPQEEAEIESEKQRNEGDDMSAVVLVQLMEALAAVVVVDEGVEGGIIPEVALVGNKKENGGEKVIMTICLMSMATIVQLGLMMMQGMAVATAAHTEATVGMISNTPPKSQRKRPRRAIIMINLKITITQQWQLLLHQKEVVVGVKNRIRPVMILLDTFAVDPAQ